MNPLAPALAGSRALSFTGGGRDAGALFRGDPSYTDRHPQPAGGPGEGGYGMVNLGRIGSGLLRASTFAPGWAGVGMGAIQAGLKGYNTFKADQINRGLGGEGFGLGQWIGGIGGLNERGSLSGNQTIFNREDAPATPGTAVTTGGIYDADPLGGADIFGAFSDPRTSYTTPEYVQHRNVNPAINPNLAASAMAMGQAGATPSPLASAIAGPSAVPANPGMPGMMTPGAPAKPAGGPAVNGVAVTSYGLNGAVNLANGTTVDSRGNVISGPASNGPGNFGAGQGAPRTVAGGTFGNQDTGGMAGPVNRNAATGMLSRA